MDWSLYLPVPKLLPCSYFFVTYFVSMTHDSLKSLCFYQSQTFPLNQADSFICKLLLQELKN